ncbi:two-component sensor histidine kinase [Paenibacillus sp. CCS19]|uniref:sensor histidine kinase n=1 Tax=Paenibacillus sp. CCS19 TaxID=3158387 RepID=UPI00256A8726|nr:HAMP domain-containing sensor histidine kinase [Paenibacillus cellulosilyticus]GMK40182.1 two-component sensor histidine kinase [Paenibacillus cellulosilyticus]
MNARGVIHKLKTRLTTKSLRSQLLARSLFILAALLILIGGLQYTFMRDFLYRNQAEAMMSELRNMPRDLFGEGWSMGDLNKAHKGMDSNHDNNPAQGGASGSDNKAQMPDNVPNYDEGTGGRPNNPVFYMLDKSMAIVDLDGTYTDVTASRGIASPRLSDAQYDEVREQMVHQREVQYRVATSEDGTEQLLVFTNTFPGSDAILQLGQKTAPLKDVLLRQLSIFAGLSILALIGGILLFLPALRRTLRPLNRMVETVARIDAGSLNERFPADQGQLEIDRLADSFNGMLERLAHSFEAEREAKEQMRRFIADASHELRTPLTSIHGFIEVLLRGAADRREQLYPALNSMHGESTRIKKLVEDLLTLAKLDRAPQLHLSEVRLDRLMEEMEPHLHMLAGEREVRFLLDSPILVKCDADKIKQVVLNLFHNAVQHTDASSGIIEVTVQAMNGQAVSSIRDNGAGIAEEHVPHVFDRFYRSDTSRTRKHGGAGLGLAISQSLIAAHEGKMFVESKLGDGSTFTFTLPLLGGSAEKKL